MAFDSIVPGSALSYSANLSHQYAYFSKGIGIIKFDFECKYASGSYGGEAFNACDSKFIFLST